MWQKSEKLAPTEILRRTRRRVRVAPLHGHPTASNFCLRGDLLPHEQTPTLAVPHRGVCGSDSSVRRRLHIRHRRRPNQFKRFRVVGDGESVCRTGDGQFRDSSGIPAVQRK